MDDWYMIMRDAEIAPSEIYDMTYSDMLLEVMRKLDPQRNPQKKPDEEASSLEDLDDDAYFATIRAMTGQ